MNGGGLIPGFPGGKNIRPARECHSFPGISLWRAVLFLFGVNSLGGALYFKSGWKKNRLCIQLYTYMNRCWDSARGLFFFGKEKIKRDEDHGKQSLFVFLLHWLFMTGSGQDGPVAEYQTVQLEAIAEKKDEEPEDDSYETDLEYLVNIP